MHRMIYALLAALVGLSAPAAADQAAFEKAFVLAEAVLEDCKGRGTVDYGELREIDFNADGFMDMALDAASIKCASGGRSRNCGMQVCLSRFYFFDGTRYHLVAQFLGRVGEVTPDTVPPKFTLGLHGGRAALLVWDGRQFVEL